MSTIEQVPANEWQEWIESRAGTLLDVREPQEWELGTLPGAVTISMNDVPTRLDDLPRDGGLLVVCRSGARSDRVAAFLAMNGFQDVANLAGGMKALGMQD
jgi:rhodanese-related sulfurtransferase